MDIQRDLMVAGNDYPYATILALEALWHVEGREEPPFFNASN